MATKLLCLLAFALVLAVHAAPEPRESRLVGGTPTTIEEEPYVVAFIYYYSGPAINIQRCVGVLVSSWHVLTTGFCFTGAVLSNMMIRAGSTNSMFGGSLSTIDRFTKHPDYVETPRAGDIAVVHLTAPFGITNTINVLFLPPQSMYIADGSAVKVVSWGFESETGIQLDTLKTISLYKVPLDECIATYQGSENVVISDPVICVSKQGPYGTCRGDSGAPMVMGQVVVGLSSYFEDCGSDKPDVFTRVDRYTNWILEVAASSGVTNSDVRAVPIAVQN